MKLPYWLVDVFARTAFEGNPLAVFPFEPALDEETMQAVAREMNLSESVFIRAALDKHCSTYPVRIFSPTCELSFAGHPVIGTAFTIASAIGVEAGGTTTLNLVLSSGQVDIAARCRDDAHGSASFWYPGADTFDLGLDATDLAAMLGLTADDIRVEGVQPIGSWCGVTFSLIPLTSRRALDEASLDLATWQALLGGRPGAQVYPYVLNDAGDMAAVRMFAPDLGQAEDTGTGAAALALGAYLATVRGPHTVDIRQGPRHGRTGRLRVACSTDRPGEVSLSGDVAMVGRGELHIRGRDAARGTYVEQQ